MTDPIDTVKTDAAKVETVAKADEVKAQSFVSKQLVWAQAHVAVITTVIVAVVGLLVVHFVFKLI